MFNYTLDKEKSKWFVRYYKEDGDRINVFFQDKTTISVENNDYVKMRLNNIQEQQVENHNKSDNALDTENPLKTFFKFVAGTFVTLMFCVVVVGGADLIFIDFKLFTMLVKTLLSITSITSLALCPAFFLNSNFAKFNLFLKYKDRLNQKIDKLNEEADKKNENSLNKVETKKIKNLCINDVNFMSYFKLKKMTNQIDKEERKARKIAELESTARKRASYLGVESNKVLVKTKNSTI